MSSEGGRGKHSAWDRTKKDLAVWGKSDQHNGAATQVGNVVWTVLKQ